MDIRENALKIFLKPLAALIAFGLLNDLASAEVICNKSIQPTNIRKGPSAKNYPVVGTLPNGAQVEVVKKVMNPEGHEWLKVLFKTGVSEEERVGFVSTIAVADDCGVRHDNSPKRAMKSEKAEVAADSIYSAVMQEEKRHYGPGGFDGLKGVPKEMLELHYSKLMQISDIHGEAAYEVAVRLDGGFGVERDSLKALRMFETVADKHKNPLAFRHIAEHYKHIGEHQTAYDWAKRSPKSKELLKTLAFQAGNDRYDGEKTKEPETLRFWLEAAADYDDPKSLKVLGFAYEDGALGLKKNLTLAASLYEKAHKLGEPGATLPLAAMFANGWGVPQDQMKSIVLAKEAYARNDDYSKNAKKFLKRFCDANVEQELTCLP